MLKASAPRREGRRTVIRHNGVTRARKKRVSKAGSSSTPPSGRLSNPPKGAFSLMVSETGPVEDGIRGGCSVRTSERKQRVQFTA